MKQIVLSGLLLVGLSISTAALASDDAKCMAPENEWQPKEAVTQKLEAEGWKVRKVKVEDGCYEAYALKGDERAEVFLNPKTLEVVRIKKDD
ncbi:PepSY domain-containing protein [Terasakiella pusilla]|uniref:PepSY domain-containing protein n=1 Tax=Terasakiella pusilla TaxID=64973 RepID=UPI003AA80FB0